MMEEKKMTKCQFPGCRKNANKSWALVDLCKEHHDEIKEETLQYYGQKQGTFHLSYDGRQYFSQIAHLIPWKKGYGRGRRPKE
jgi:hypothetical protein